MVDQLLADLSSSKVRADEIQALFAGGIHDAASSAIVQVIAAPLAAKGVNVGILMGSAYLFTKEIVDSGAIVREFQQEVIGCERTINLESGPGHASRCAYTPFAREFVRKRIELREAKAPLDEARQALDLLILGRLRLAAKGVARDGSDGPLRELETEQQRSDGMYMLGQVATLRAQITDIETMHREVTSDASALLSAHASPAVEADVIPQKPAD